MFPVKRKYENKDYTIFIITSNGINVFICVITALTFLSTDPCLTNCFFLKRSIIYGIICSVNFNIIALTITNVMSN